MAFGLVGLDGLERKELERNGWVKLEEPTNQTTTHSLSCSVIWKIDSGDIFVLMCCSIHKSTRGS
jgi:hypothetical protein